MNFKQKILKALYPLIMRLSKSDSGKGKILFNEKVAQPEASFYDLKVTLNNGDVVHFDQFKGRKVLLANTASNCGYTGQYAALQRLHERFQEKLSVIGFPSNDFQEQEKGSDQEIAEFWQVNYGVAF